MFNYLKATLCFVTTKIKLRLSFSCATPILSVFLTSVYLTLNSKQSRLVPFRFAVECWDFTSSEVDCLPYLSSQAVPSSSCHFGSITASSVLVLLNLVSQHERLGSPFFYSCSGDLFPWCTSFSPFLHGTDSSGRADIADTLLHS